MSTTDTSLRNKRKKFLRFNLKSWPQRNQTSFHA